MNSELHVILVDDEPLCRDSLRTSLSNFPYVSISGEASNGQETIALLQKCPQVNVVFLDIEMADINGFQLARHIRSTYPDIAIIFLTGHVSFALEGYEYAPVDFLIKPVNLLRLEQALNRVRESQNPDYSQDINIGIHTDGVLEIINVNRVLFLEKSGRRVTIVEQDGTQRCSSDSLQTLQRIFEPYGFFRCHQSFLIPVNRIRSVRLDSSKNSYSIQLTDWKDPIPLSRNRYNELMAILRQKGIRIF